ncbi:MAG: methyl-accepting chemotaxis protein [Ignavibacteriales bacterium]|nr:MAG: methyl-accepting chemotaxis protein [Ignavibacteriales bacterium]
MLNYMKIGMRLALGFAFALIALAFIILFSVTRLSGLDEEVNFMANDRFPKTVWANNIIDNINEGARVIRNILLVTDPSARKTEFDRLPKTAAAIDANVDSLKRTITTTEGKALIQKFEDVRQNQYYPVRERVINEINNGNETAAVEILLTDFREAQRNYMNACKELINYQTELMHQSAILADESYTSSRNLMYIIGLITIIAVLGFGLVITKSIVSPVSLVAERIQQLQTVCITNLGNGLLAMEKGDLTAKVEKATKHLSLNRKDEVGKMADTVDKMITMAQGGIDAYEGVREKIKDLSHETTKLINDAKEGRLDKRADASKFEGAYSEIVTGFNGVLDAVILPVQDGAKVLEEMATGDLTVRVTKEYKGQHQNIKNSINRMGESLSSVISDVAEAVAAAASASTQISSSTEEMAAGAQEQSSQANEVAAAVEQMTTTILQSSKHASSTAQTAKNAGTFARDGGKVVKDTINGMGRIDEVVSAAAITVRELGKSSDQIGEIVQVIDEIADQTNLLALNAAIEAARAGEQGRGFAVVADEVRKLAERTTKATKEIAGMIKKIQVDTNGAVDSIGRGTEEVAKGRELATQAGESLEQIIKGAEEVVDLATQVASASEEQSSAAEQISKNIEAISSVTQQSAAGTQQIARAAEDLNRLTDNLQSLISKFKVDDKKSASKYGVRQNGKIVEV